MSIEMSKGKRILFIITILLTNFAVMGDNVLYPIIYNLYGEFYDQIGAVNYIVSGPLLVIFIVSLIASKLLRIVSKKTMLIVGGTIFAISTIAGAIVPSATYMVIMRTFTGVGQALVNVAAIALIAEVYVDENKRGWMMGIYNACLGAVGAVFGFISGFLATVDWRNSYNIYWVSVPMVIMMIIFLPSIRPVKEENLKQEKQKREPFSLNFWVIIFCLAVVTIAFNMMAFYVSLYVAEHGLGNEAVAGILSTCIAGGSVVLTLTFGFLYSKLKKNTLMLSFIILAAALILLYFIPNVIVAGFSFVLVGGAYGMAFAFSYAHGSAIAPVGKVDDAIGIATATYAISGFLSTYISTWLMNVMNTNGTITPTLVVPIVAMILFIVIYPIITKEKQMNLSKTGGEI